MPSPTFAHSSFIRPAGALVLLLPLCSCGAVQLDPNGTLTGTGASSDTSGVATAQASPAAPPASPKPLASASNVQLRFAAGDKIRVTVWLP
jgi:hypothetical protein